MAANPLPFSSVSPNPWDHVDARIAASVFDVRVSLICRITTVTITADRTTVDCVPVIQERINDNGILRTVTLPVLLDVPVVLPRGGGFALTLPLQPGDEGTVVFHDTCFDNWWQNGGDDPQPEWERRRHDLSDGQFFPGVYSTQTSLQDWSTDSMQLRSEDGKTVIDIADGQVTITADDVVVNATNAQVNAQQGATVKAQTINAQAQQSATVQAQSISVQAQQGLILQGQTVTITGQGGVTVNGQAGVTVNGSAGIHLNGSAQTVIDGKLFVAHAHVGVQGGPGVSGPPV